MTDINSPEVQAIFAKLHALGVSPEQAAAGVASINRFRIGEEAVYYGALVTVDATDYDGCDGLEVCVKRVNGDRWVPHRELDRVEVTK
jgi:hypothetical protein